MKKFLIRLLIIMMILMAGTALFMCKSYTVYNLVYIFCFVFITFYAVYTPAAIGTKVVQVLLYAFILAAQIVFNVLVIRMMAAEISYDLYRLLGICIMAVPFIVRTTLFHHTAGREG